MISILGRVRSIFSSSAPSIKAEAEEQNESDELARSDIEERIEGQILDLRASEGEVVTERMGVNGSGEDLEHAREEEAPALVKPKKTKSNTVSKKRKRNSKKATEPEDGELEPGSHQATAVSEVLLSAAQDAPVEALEEHDFSLEVEQSRSKRTKKAQGGKKKRKSVDTAESIEPEPHPEDDENLDDPAAVAVLLNEASKRKKASEPILPGMKPRTVIASQAAVKSPQLVIKPRARTSLISVPSAGEERLDNALGELLPDPSETSQSVKKAKKPPKRTRKTTPKEIVAGDIDENEPAAPSQLTLISAVVPPPPASDDAGEEMSGIERTTQEESAPDASFQGGNDDGIMDPPSKKALGKRKASASALRTTKKRARKSQASPNTDIRIFGTFTPSNEANSSEAMPSEQPRFPAVSLMAADQTGGRTISDSQDEQTSSLPAINGLKQGRRGTPQFTPINQKLPLFKASYGNNSSMQVVLNSPRQTQKAAPSSPDIDEEERQASKFHVEADRGFPPVESIESTSISGTNRVPPEARPRRRLPTGDLDTPMLATSGTPARAKKSMPKAPKVPKTPKTPGTTQGRTTPGTKGKTLTESEIEEITEAVESYQSQNSLEQSELIGLIQGDLRVNGEDIRSFWNELCSLVSNIPRAKVMTLCRRKYHSYIRGAWSEEQDDDLRVAVAQNPGKWKIIGPLLNRFPEDARLRWRDYVSCGDALRKDVWEPEEEDRLRDCVNECLETLQEDKRNSTDKAYKEIDAESQIDWIKVSKMMESTRSRLQCMNKWKSLKDRENTDVEDTATLAPIAEAEWRLTDAVNKASQLKPEEKLTLLRAIRDSAAGREGKIPWRAIAENVGKKGKRMVLKVCFRNLRMKVPDQQEMKLQDIVAYLINAFEAAAPKEPKGFKGMNSDMIMSSQIGIKGKSRGQSETFSTGGERKTKKGRDGKKQKRAKRLLTGGGSDNGEGSSTARHRDLDSPRPDHFQGADDEAPIPQRRKTVRERIEHHDPGTSQDAEGADDTEDFDTELKSAWQLTSTPRAKKPIVIAKTSQRKKRPKSEVRVVESDEDGGETDRESTSNNKINEMDLAPSGVIGNNNVARGVAQVPTTSDDARPTGEDLEITDKFAVHDEDSNTTPKENKTNSHGVSGSASDSSDSEQIGNDQSDDNSVEAQSHTVLDTKMAANPISQPSDWSAHDDSDAEDTDQIMHERPQEDAESSSDEEESTPSLQAITNNGSFNDVIRTGNSDDESEDDEQMSNKEESQSEDDVRNDPFNDFSGLPLSLPNGDRTYDSSDDSGDEYRRNLFDDDKEYDDEDEHLITMNGFSRKGTVDPDADPNAQSEADDFDRVPRKLLSPSPLSVSSDDTTSSIAPVATTAHERARRKAREASIEL